MRRLMLPGAILSVLALSATMPAFAAAEGQLPEFTVTTSFTGTSGKDVLETVGKTAITCSKSKTSGEVIKGHEGTFTLTLEGCKEGKVACRGENSKGEKEPIETILVAGKLEPVTVSLTEEVAGVILLLKETYLFVCGTIKMELKGNVLSAFKPANEETTAFEMPLTQTGGKQSKTEYYNEKGAKTKVSSPLEMNAVGKFEATGAEAAENKLTTAKKTELFFGANLEMEMAGLFLGVKKTAAATATSVYTAGFLGGKSGLLKTLVLGAASFEEVGGNCKNNLGLNSTETCTVKILCIGAVGDTGEVRVESARIFPSFVRNGRRQLKCE